MKHYNFLNEDDEFTKQIPNFVEREPQIEMAHFVSELIQGNQNGLIEAGTGTGKTFAYLLPALKAGKKILISTGTKNLQDQLFYKDLPLVNNQYKYKIALLKGRSNYLCPKRLNNNLTVLSNELDQSALSELVRIRDWSLHTKSGDLNEISDLEKQKKILPLITSSNDNCYGRACDYIQSCPVYAARDKAMTADVVVINHHLLFSDIGIEEKTQSSILPQAELIIVDEAHQIPDIARQFFGEAFYSFQIIDLLRDVEKEQSLIGNDDVELQLAAEALSAQLQLLVEKLISNELSLEILLSQMLIQDAIDDLDISLGELAYRLGLVRERSTGYLNCEKRALRLIDSLMHVTTGHLGESVRWIGRKPRGFVLHNTPLDVAESLKLLFTKQNKSWLFVSATLTVSGSFQHYKQNMGLEKIEERVFTSPFNYQKQVAAFIPQNLPSTGTDLHTRALLEQMLPFIRHLSGRVFYLFTSHRALQLTADLLNHEHDITYLSQGAMSKKKLLEKFMQLDRCVLLATHSFWEGVDVRGADLRCLIIDKLPFESPENPLLKARLKTLALSGQDGFNTYSLPQAVISLKQGFGRLIRQESDRGLFILGDDRIMTKAYGSALFDSLPKMSWLKSESEVLEYIEDL